MSTLCYKFFSKKFKLLRSGQIGLSFSLPMCCCFKLSSYYIEKLHAWHRRMQTWSLDSAFLFLFHLAQREPGGCCQHRQQPDQTNGRGTQHIISTVNNAATALNAPCAMAGTQMQLVFS